MRARYGSTLSIMTTAMLIPIATRIARSKILPARVLLSKTIV